MTPQQLPLPAERQPLNPELDPFYAFGISPKQDAKLQLAEIVAHYRSKHPGAEIEVWSRAEVPVPPGTTLVIDRRIPLGSVWLGGH